MNWLSRFLARTSLIIRARLVGRTSRLCLAEDVAPRVSKTARVEVAGIFRLGFPLNREAPFSSRRQTALFMGDGAKLKVNGNVSIANGCSLIVGRNAEVVLNGPLSIAHDCIILCNIGIEFGANSAVSWGCTLIDSDLHDPISSSGRTLRRPRRRLTIGERVGIQAGVIIPAGLTIGNDAVVSAGTVLRQSIGPGCLVYSDHKLRIRKDTKSGLPWG